MAAGDLSGADAALQQLDKFNGFQPLKDFQLGLLYDFANQPDKADAFFTKTLADNQQLNWRLTDAIANFYERHGKADKAKALYQKFMDQNAGSEIAQTVLSSRPPGTATARRVRCGCGRPRLATTRTGCSNARTARPRISPPTSRTCWRRWSVASSFRSCRSGPITTAT